MKDFKYLFELDNYKDEESVEFYKFDGVKDIGKPICVPETLFTRITCIGRAYELHYLSIFSPYEDYMLEKTQVEELIEEFCFILSLVNDRLLQKYINDLLMLSKDCIYNSKCYYMKIIGY